jgi:hypothetical protein
MSRWFGEDPIVEQRLVLERCFARLRQFERGREELTQASTKAAAFLGQFELPSVRSVWCGAFLRRSLSELQRVAVAPAEAAQRQLDQLVEGLAASQAEDVEALVLDKDGNLLEQDHLRHALEPAAAPIVVRRADMVRSSLGQIAARPVRDLLLGVTMTPKVFPSLADDSLAGLLGFRVQFVGEDGLDMGGVRKDFMDCFAAALARTEPGRLTLVEPLSLLSLSADCTWRPAVCNEKDRGHLWALGRLLALALVYRCPCPIPLSLLVFKCILGTKLRPGDVRQLDPDFWNHRVKPLLRPRGIEIRQAELREWTMDPLTFESADGLRELKLGGKDVPVTEDNKSEYLQLLCEDVLIGPIRTELGCLVMGFHEVVSEEHLQRSSLDAEQLRMLVCGVAELSVVEWRAHAKVEGPRHVAAWFFGWLERQPQETRSKVLAFATGSSVLPSGWDGLKDQQGEPLPFRISVQGEENALPSAHTCANLLVLPPVRTADELEGRLEQMLEMCGREMLIF